MTVRWSLEDDGRVLRLVTGERFTSEDMGAKLEEAIAACAAQLPLLLLFDNRGSEENASPDELRRRSRYFRELGPKVFAPRVAVLVSDDLHYALGRMSAAFAESEGYEVEVFRDEQSARRWLLRAPAGAGRRAPSDQV